MKEFELQKKFNWELASEKIQEPTPIPPAPIEFQYQIGDYVSTEGGVIYHRFMEGDTQNYLVLDLIDLGEYDVYGNYNDEAPWSNIVNGSPLANSLWDGEYNTARIVEVVGTISGAGYICNTSNRGGKSDWYLPAIHQLNKIWNNMYEVSKGLQQAGGNQLKYNTANTEYWSSTGNGLFQAFNLNFFTGTSFGASMKNGNKNVRAVRRFTI